MPPILEARGLTKRFKTTEALAGLDLTAERGQVTAILGPNGAGKTTFIRMVATLLLPDEGSLTVAGIDAIKEPDKVRRAIGLAGQSAAVEGAMTGRENLVLVGRLFGHDSRQARASAEVDRSGKAVSAVGWKRIADGTSGQSEAVTQASGADRLDRARRYSGTTVAAHASRTRPPVRASAARSATGSAPTTWRKPSSTDQGRCSTTNRASFGRDSIARKAACEARNKPGGWVPTWSASCLRIQSGYPARNRQGSSIWDLATV